MKGAVASFVAVGIPDERAAIVRDNPTIRETYPVVNVNFFNEPTPDGKYGYKVVLPTGPINGINISVERLKVTMPAFTLSKKKVKCTKKRGGKCVKRKVTKKNIFMWTKPDCPRAARSASRPSTGTQPRRTRPKRSRSRAPSSTEQNPILR